MGQIKNIKLHIVTDIKGEKMIFQIQRKLTPRFMVNEMKVGEERVRCTGFIDKLKDREVDTYNNRPFQSREMETTCNRQYEQLAKERKPSNKKKRSQIQILKVTFM